MGTKESTIAFQQQIKQISSEIGWTQNRLSRIIFTELNDIDNEDEIIKFQERFKKELQRSTTKTERLKEYLEIILRHPDAKNITLIFNKSLSENSLTKETSQAMKEISQELDKFFHQ